jgi:phosphatidylglycerophosphatase A
MTRFALVLATGAYSGYFPIAPGTAGSVVGLLLFFGLRRLGTPSPELLAIAVLFLAGVWAAGVAERHFGREDPGPVVLDEIVGMLVTLAFVPVSLDGALAGFVAFRVLDVVKPWPADRLEHLGGGLGIMADDVMAGLYAQLTVRVLCWLLPAWMVAP